MAFKELTLLATYLQLWLVLNQPWMKKELKDGSCVELCPVQRPLCGQEEVWISSQERQKYEMS